MEEKFEEWFPRYRDGTLPEKERAELDRYLASHPEAKADLDVFLKVASGLDARYSMVPSDIGLDKVIKKNRAFDAESMGLKDKELKETQTKSNGWRNWVPALLGGSPVSWAQPAFALALVVIGVQSAMLLRPSEEIQMRSSKDSPKHGDALANAYLLRVAFQPTATEGEIRVLLAGNNARFVAGPDSEGTYTVAVPTNESIRVLETLKVAKIVAAVQPISSAR
jgi:hypothetical protein